MGSAGGDLDPRIVAKCRDLGREIAENGCCLLTGACPGLPHEAALGAKESGGHTVGISPAASLKEHVELFHSPYEDYDVLIYTGLGLMGREVVNIRSSDIVVVVGGRCGTLGEFAIAFEEGKLIGVLTGTGGIAEALEVLGSAFDKPTGSEIISDADPATLVSSLIERYLSPDYRCPCRPRSSCENGDSFSCEIPSPGRA